LTGKSDHSHKIRLHDRILQKMAWDYAWNKVITTDIKLDPLHMLHYYFHFSANKEDINTCYWNIERSLVMLESLLRQHAIIQMENED
jgi:hypothetical protein